MLFKVISIVMALGALALFLFRALRGERPDGGPGARGVPARARASSATELVACDRCGAYRPAGAPCPCRTAPTP